MTSWECDLKNFLARLFGRADCFLPGTSVKEKGKTFSIQPRNGEQVVGLRVDGCLLADTGVPKCDAIFFLFDAAQGRLLIILVELKGGDVAHALDQLVSTRHFLVKATGCGWEEHKKKLAPLFSDVGKSRPSHNGSVLGVVVGPKGLPQIQQKKLKSLTTYGIRYKPAKRANNLLCQDLFAWARQAR
jgi:hypothetical protein